MAWADLSFDELVATTHDWTRDSIRKMKDAGAKPDMVQVGNEITPGMMTDKGGTVKEVDPTILTMLHIDKGGNHPASVRWLEKPWLVMKRR